MHPADRRQLEEVVQCVIEVFGETLVAVYLYGSALMGGLRRGSDLDLLVVIETSTKVDQRRRLVDALLAVSGNATTPRTGRPVEVTVVRRNALGTIGSRHEREFQFGEWMRDELETGHIPGPEIDPDLAPLLATVLTASVVMVGPPAPDLIQPVPHHRLVDAMRESVPSLVADLDTDTANVLLTLARMWRTRETGDIVGKDAAAGWALDRLPSDLRLPLEHARAVYAGNEAAAFEQLGTAPSETATYLSATILS